MRNIYRTGQAKAEYGLILALLALLCIASLKGVGGNVEELFSGIASAFPQSKSYQASVKPTSSATQHNPHTSAGSTSETASTSSLPRNSRPQQQCAGTFCISLDADTSLAPTLTAGSNGDIGKIQQHVRTLREIAEALAKDPNADPSLIAHITTLANQGHLIAAVGSSVYSKVDGNGLNLKNVPAETISNYHLAQLGFTETKAKVDSYLQAKPAALSPEIKARLQTNARMVEQEATTYVQDGKDGQVTKMAAIETPSTESNNPMGQIHERSNTICENGGNETECIRR